MDQPYAGENIRVVAVIQARMGSTRLPGKVLTPVAGKPLLWHILHRLKACRLVEEIAVATSVNPADEAIVEWCQAEGVTVVRGPEEDVLARFAQAAEKLDADVIVRVSADAPFIDAGFVDHLVASLIEQDADYVLMEEGAACAHEGVDPFSRRALDRLMMDAADDPAAREHVTGYFKLHPDFVRIARAAPYPALAKKVGRLTIDTPDDLAFVEALHARLCAQAGEASLADLLLLLEREPQLRRINGHVRQKPLQSQAPAGGMALIRCDGGGKFGYGHVKRMLTLARALRDRQGIGVTFALNAEADAGLPLRRAGFALSCLTAPDDLQKLIDARRPDLFILDGREGPSHAELLGLRSRIGVSAVIDDADARRLACDYAYYPPVPGAFGLDWSGSRTVVRIGWQWALLGLGPHGRGSDSGHAPLTTASRPTLLVTMGGSDPQGLTLRMAKALVALDRICRIRFVLASGMKDATLVAKALVAQGRNYETVEGADDLATEYANADLALCAFGVSAYELAAMGVPAVYLCLSQDHAASASALVDAGMGISLGLAHEISDADIARTLCSLLHRPALRRRMRQCGLRLIDGGAAERIAADLAQALGRRRAFVTTAR